MKQDSFLVVVKKGEDLHAAMIKAVTENDLKGSVFSGIGALSNPVIGFFDENTKTYIEKKLEGFYELLSANGNVTMVDDQFFAHIHVVLGGEGGHVIGGHLLSGTVGLTAEILVTPLEKTPVRKFDEETGFKLISMA